MNINLIPNIEPVDKFVDYFMHSVGQPFSVSETHISVDGGIPTLDALPKKPPKLPIVLITEPEAAARQAESMMKNEHSEMKALGLKSISKTYKRHIESDISTDNNNNSSSSKKNKSISGFVDVFG